MKKISALLLLGIGSLAGAAPVASGKLVLPPELSAKAKGIRTVFLTIQDPKATTPMPCAAKKFTLDKDAQGEFLSFTLDETSLMMMACSQLPETMNLKAKLDKDGSAGRDAAGDIVGTLTGVKKGSDKLTIKLEKAI